MKTPLPKKVGEKWGCRFNQSIDLLRGVTIIYMRRLISLKNGDPRPTKGSSRKQRAISLKDMACFFYFPTTFTKISRWRARLSKSKNTRFCQVPKTNFPFSTGTAKKGLIKADLIWA